MSENPYKSKLGSTGLARHYWEEGHDSRNQEVAALTQRAEKAEAAVERWKSSLETERSARLLQLEEFSALLTEVKALREKVKAGDADTLRLDCLEKNGVGIDLNEPAGKGGVYDVGQIQVRGITLMRLMKSDATGLYWKRIMWRDALDEALAAYNALSPASPQSTQPEADDV